MSSFGHHGGTTAILAIAEGTAVRARKDGNPNESASSRTLGAVHHIYHAVFYETEAGGYVGYVEEIPGANTEANTLAEARQQLSDAVKLIFEANRQVLHDRLPRKRLIREQLNVEL
jgi:predicted RNase H-like HicB family nuclease